MQNGNTKGPVLLTGSLRYNQFLVIWGVCPRTQQQAGFLAERSMPTAAFPGKHPVTDAKSTLAAGSLITVTRSCGICTCFPFTLFYAQNAASKGTCCRIQFYGSKYNTMCGEVQGHNG